MPKGRVESVDGGHIQCLHMTFFYNFMRPIIEKGYLYAACPPLFKVFKKSKGKDVDVHYLYTKQELDAFDTEGYSVQRYKGLENRALINFSANQRGLAV